MERSTVLRAIAVEVLNAVGQADVEQLIMKDDLDTAAKYLLGGIDRRVQDNMVSFDRAAELYKLLDLDQDTVLRLRARHAHGSVT
jgi:hypothetical protein